jgi:hypothetical protein
MADDLAEELSIYLNKLAQTGKLHPETLAHELRIMSQHMPEPAAAKIRELALAVERSDEAAKRKRLN